MCAIAPWSILQDVVAAVLDVGIQIFLSTLVLQGGLGRHVVEIAAAVDVKRHWRLGIGTVIAAAPWPTPPSPAGLGPCAAR